MTCSNCSQLKNELEQKNTQIIHYEGKIRDTVNAYKMLETQKQSLEVALNVLSEQMPDEPSCEENRGESTSHESPENSSQEIGEVVDKIPTKPKSQMVELREAISTLTLINKRKEIEFKRDRRTLLEAKEEAQKRIAELEVQLNHQLQKTKSQNLRRLREQLAESQSALERAMTEHGMVLAEKQQQYGLVKRHSENLEKQITDMSQRLASKDDLLKRAELQLKELPKLEQEIRSLRKKTELTPSVCVIHDELANVKSNSEQEISTLSTRYAMQSAQMRERDSRIEQLEKRLQEISEKYAQTEHKSIEFKEKCNELEKNLAEKLLQLKKIEDEERKRNLLIHLLESENMMENENVEKLIERFTALVRRISELQPDFDIAALLPLEFSTATNFKHRVADSLSLTNSCEPIIAVDRLSLGLNGANSPEISRNTSSVSLSALAFCDSCSSSRRELDLLKSRIGQLQSKFSTLETSHERTKREHESTSVLLRERIIELETSQNKRYAQLTANARDKVVELEEELQKQRTRMLEIVAEKDHEIEFTKSSLAAFYTRNYGPSPLDSQNNFPMDPLQKATKKFSISSPLNSPAFTSSNNQSLQKSINVSNNRHLTSKDSVDGLDIRRESIPDHVLDSSSELGCRSPILLAQSHEQLDFSASLQSSLQNRRKSSRPLSFQLGGESALIAGAAARNIFYEQELCKREQEIGELRNVIRLLEMKVRDIEQAMLLKDVQYLQIIETLKEEIRILESRLSLENSQTNLAYLRNIFVQFLNQNSASGRKHILKAIGAVLQLTHIEMCKVDRWTH